MERSVNVSRRNLLRGRVTSTPAAIRPPGAISELDFTNNCTTCGDCITACPQHIIFSGSGGFPEVDFRRGECTFCTQCIESCQEGALSKAVQPPWQFVLRVSDQCLARRQVVCQTCGDACEVEAVRFKARFGSAAVPWIDQDTCNGCGACIASCPENAITALAHTSPHGSLHG